MMTRSTGARRERAEMRRGMRWDDLPEAVQEEMTRRLGQRYRDMILNMSKQAQQYFSPSEALDLMDKQLQDLRRVAARGTGRVNGGTEGCPHTTMTKVRYKKDTWICTTEGFPSCHKEVTVSGG